MKLIQRSQRSQRIQLAWVVCASLTLGVGCHRSEPATGLARAEARDDGKDAPLTLTDEEQAKAGITAVAAEHAETHQTITGYGVVLSHDAIAQVVADVLQAEAVERQSKAALDRAKRLSGTPGAISSDLQETAARQAAVDATATILANQKLSAVVGQSPPWHTVAERERALQAIANGESKLVRVTFSLSDAEIALPATFQLSRFSPNTRATRWKSEIVWRAPADAAVPGYSYFAMLRASELLEGERVLVRTNSTGTLSGFLIPESAVVLYGGRSWFYLEHTPGQFVRIELESDKQGEAGYIAQDGVTAGDRIVTAGAGLLLARETGTAEAE